MQFELTKEFISILQEFIENGRDNAIQEALHGLHPADISDVMEELKSDEATYIYKLLENEEAADVLIELEDDELSKLLSVLTSKEIAEIIDENVDSDDAADVIQLLPQQKQEEVISKISDESQASDIIALLQFEEGTAGAIMAKELVAVNINWTVGQAIREMRKQADDLENVYTIYVIDDKGILKGRLSLKQLLFSATSTRTTIKEIYTDEDLRSVESDEDVEEVADVMQKYDLVVIPVITGNNLLVGRITIDDVVDVIKDEAGRDYQMASGISERVDSEDRIQRILRARFPWLLIGLIGGIFGALVINIFEHDIKIYPEMAFFIPLIAAMGGNVGVQSSAIIVQGLANKTIGLSSTGQKLLKELGVATLNGIILALVILAFNLRFGDSLALSYTVSIALFCVIIFASLFGTLTPLVLDKVNIDPALATGPFITTANDIVGLFIYFIIGRVMYLYFQELEACTTILEQIT
ncbi:MAG TPA: magnesium transporter [Flavobacteriales bacterium]|nr:magnesium transporter [Flavobacteriales bacterium]|tara:strand:- start:7674 stop:9083 length:1410 start_codon:yes stop_codon:yes gene_type:complete